jgi:hypothetical protein
MPTSAPVDSLSPAQLVQRHLDSYNARDAAGVGQCFAPDGVIRDEHGNVLASGQAAVTAAYAQLMEAYPNRRVTVVDRLSVGSWVIDHQVANRPGEAPQDAVTCYRVDHTGITAAFLLR